STIQPPSHLLPPTGLTSPMIWKLQPSLALSGSLNHTRRPHSLPPQSVISTAPRPVWSIHTPSGLGAARANGQAAVSATANGPMARFMMAIIAFPLAFVLRTSTRVPQRINTNCAHCTVTWGTSPAPGWQNSAQGQQLGRAGPLCRPTPPRSALQERGTPVAEVPLIDGAW